MLCTLVEKSISKTNLDSILRTKRTKRSQTPSMYADKEQPNSFNTKVGDTLDEGLEEDIENDNSGVDATYKPNENQEDLDEETTNTASTSVASNKIKKKVNNQTKSDIWPHFDRKMVNGIDSSICKYCACSFQYSATTSSLRRHILEKHKEIDIKRPSSSAKSGSSSQFDLLILKMIISSASPYRLVENIYFKQLVAQFTNQKLLNRSALRVLENQYYDEKTNEIINKRLNENQLKRAWLYLLQQWIFIGGLKLMGEVS